jgi:hypothetical protein
VDNPSLILGFTDANGAPVTLTGTASLFAADQNPALDPSPLATLKIENSDSLLLLGSDVTRSRSLAKAAASGVRSADTAVVFNLLLRGDSGAGFFVAGLVYNPKAKAFFGRRGDSLRSLAVRPRPLIRYQATLMRPDGATDTGKAFGRVYIPGSPFRAVLVDSLFVFPELPQGIFPLRMLAEDGRVFAVRESLNTQSAMNFTATPTPLDRIPPDPATPAFMLNAGPDREAFLGGSNFLQAKIMGVEDTDARLSVLWKQIHERGDTSAHRALLVSPTTLYTEVKFPAEGVYRFAVAATVGLRTLRDTVLISVRKQPIPAPRIIQPKPG